MNGAGKTNLLEALAVLCGWGAFEGNRTSSLVTWPDGQDSQETEITDSTEISGSKNPTGTFLLARAEGERKVEVRASISSRISFSVEGERATYSSLRALLPAFVFLPRDIGLLDGSPSLRRLFLDRLCALLSPLYARRLAEYRKILRQRSALLRSPCPAPSALEATALPLVRFGGWIRVVRWKTAAALKEAFALQDFGLLPRGLKLDLDHRGSTRTFDPSDPADAAAGLAADLRENFERERRAGIPLMGPHRDDLLFSCFGRPASQSLSRGQKRRTVAASVLAAGQVIHSRMRVTPILLLDDIAAELDGEGRRLMGQALTGSGWQVFVTAASADAEENPFSNETGNVALLREGEVLHNVR
jgi:DNA replication and repair protein RecF